MTPSMLLDWRGQVFHSFYRHTRVPGRNICATVVNYCWASAVSLLLVFPIGFLISESSRPLVQYVQRDCRQFPLTSLQAYLKWIYLCYNQSFERQSFVSSQALELSRALWFINAGSLNVLIVFWNRELILTRRIAVPLVEQPENLLGLFKNHRYSLYPCLLKTIPWKWVPWSNIMNCKSQSVRLQGKCSLLIWEVELLVAASSIPMSWNSWEICYCSCTVTT